MTHSFLHPRKNYQLPKEKKGKVKLQGFCISEEIFVLGVLPLRDDNTSLNKYFIKN